MNSLDEMFLKHNITIQEGHIGQVFEQRKDILDVISSKKDIKYIMEIGFNAGHSSELFLKNSDAIVYSFDIGSHFNQYLQLGKKYINKTYPQRHTLVFGDSKLSIPRFCKENDIKFDIIFIDGGHDYITAKSDLIHSKNLAHKDTIVIMDDIVSQTSLQTSWTEGPNRAWKEMIEAGLLQENLHYDYGIGRGQSFGKYII